MIPRIAIFPETKVIGMRMTMSYSDYKARELWKRFMPRRKEVLNTIGTDYYSMQLFSPTFYDNFNPTAAFEYWTAVVTTDFEKIPEGMASFTISSGLYAVFTYKGDANGAPAAFEYIFATWLPSSEYVLDHRPHFEILGDKYINDHPDSEEEIWIPVKLKKKVNLPPEIK
ncbi:GyrI-like domain-containing protein [uncultured Flavobacterium sp.]|uniref:GyrI-like domain-containing protein n=1 Tax=uncultured Flavobacterium sp. TaxID=165435 RepID=UPI0030EB9FFF|tara:strand:- start:172637 stop:173146 length:510 start_codon:yes stop_codon:yes gene_type:complete